MLLILILLGLRLVVDSCNMYLNAVAFRRTEGYLAGRTVLRKLIAREYSTLGRVKSESERRKFETTEALRAAVKDFCLVYMNSMEKHDAYVYRE